MANRPITIEGINPNGTLVLSDNGNTSTNPGDTVTWLIGANSGVRSIDGIVDDSSPTDVFNPDPAVQPNSTSWQGTINPTINFSVSENYSIHFTDNAGNQYSHDPVIQVNPKI